MSEALQKDYSIVLRVEKIPGWNRDLEQLSDTEAQGRIRQTYVEKYGSGAGNLEVVKKKSKIKLSWFPPKLSAQAEDLHKVALAKAKGRNYSEAVNNWVKAISINSSDPEYYFNLGVAFFELKNHTESIENLRKAVQVCPIYYKAHLVLGTVFIKERKFREAELHLLETINFNPNIAFAYLNLGAVYSIMKRYAEGIEMFEKSLALAPNQVKALFGLGKIYAITGDLELASKYFKEVVELDPKGLLASHAKRAMVSAPLDKPIPSPAGIDPKDIEHLYQAGYRRFCLVFIG
jgi:tetratricopeptide (TPR) repeat protein